MKIFTVVGTRPNFIKIDPELKQTLIHTGQHYSYRMNQAFFKERKLQKPRWNLGCKGNQVGKMIDKMRLIFRKEKPNIVIVFGDTNSSLAGALAGTYENIKIVHIEAGMRSHRLDMPEEINRVLIDRVATVKFCVNAQAVMNLLKEGITQNVHIVGDPMFDAMNDFMPIKRRKNYQKYNFLTIHRNYNADDKEVLKNIFEAINESKERFVFPVHPRTKKNIKSFGIEIPKNIKMIPPQGYKDTLSMIANSRIVLTDSGGVQREAYWMQKPVIILRPETEWIDIVSNGAGMLATSRDEILRGIKEFHARFMPPPKYGANEKIREILYRYL